MLLNLQVQLKQEDRMPDKIGIIEGLLGHFSTASWGVITFKDGIFYFNKKKWRDCLDPLSFAGGNAVRVLPYSLYGTPSIEQVFCPWVFDKPAGKFNLRAFSNNYFDIIEEAASLTQMPQPKGPNMSFGWELFDDCGFRPATIHLQPWSNNIQGISTMYDETEEVYLYVNEAIKRLGGKVLFMLGNEMQMSKPAAKERFSKIFPMLNMAGLQAFSYGSCVNIPLEQTHSSPLKGMQEEAELCCGVNEMIRIARPIHNVVPNSDYLIETCKWWGGNGHAVIFSDDGVSPRPGVIAWQDITRYALDNFPVNSDQFGMSGKVRVNFEHCAKTEDYAYEASVISAIAQEVERNFGPGTPSNITLENRGKEIEPYQDPVGPPPIEEPPIDDTPTVPVKPPFNLKGWFNNNWYWVLILIIIGVLLWLWLK
jgi:hypothetical protein